MKSPNWLYGWKPLNAVKKTYAHLKQDDPNGEILKPFLEGKDLKRWRAESRGLYLIFTRRGVAIDDYPLIKAHLEQFRERLEPKPNDYPANKTWGGRKAGTYQWYEIQDTVAYYKHFEKPKIQYGHFSPEPLFHFNQNGHFSNDKSYIIPTTDLSLYGLLNSSLYWFLIKALCPAVRGGFYELRSQYIETLPIPKTSPEQQKTIANLAEQCQTTAKARYELEQKVQRCLVELLRPTNNLEPLNTKLTQWWNLSSVSELKTEASKAFKLKKSQTLNESNETRRMGNLSQRQYQPVASLYPNHHRLRTANQHRRL